MYKADEVAVFSQALASDRMARGISQSRLAQELGVLSQSISKWEAGIALPRDFRMEMIANHFGEDSMTARAVGSILNGRKERLIKRAMSHTPENARDVMYMTTTQHAPRPADDLNTALALLRKLPESKQGAHAARILDAAAKLEQAKENMQLAILHLKTSVKRLGLNEKDTDTDQ